MEGRNKEKERGRITKEEECENVGETVKEWRKEEKKEG